MLLQEEVPCQYLHAFMPSLETSLSTASLLPNPIHKISATYFRIHCRSTLLLGLKFFFFFFSFWCFIGLWAVFKFYFSFSLLYYKPLQKLLVQTTTIYVNRPHFHHHILPWSGWLWMLSCVLGSGGGAEGEPDYSTPWVLPLSVSLMQNGGGGSAPHWDLLGIA